MRTSTRLIEKSVLDCKAVIKDFNIVKALQILQKFGNHCKTKLRAGIWHYSDIAERSKTYLNKFVFGGVSNQVRRFMRIFCADPYHPKFV